MASSSAHHHFPPNLHGGATAAPPPTPSTTQPNNSHFVSSEAAADALSLLLHRLPPSLSLPNRRRSTVVSSAASIPAVSLSGDDGDDLLSAATEFGYFELTDCGAMIPSEHANSAESDSLSLFRLGDEQKETWFPKTWPLGYEAGDDEDGEAASLCLDADCSTEPSSELKLTSLREFTRALERIGLKTVEELASAIGFDNPFGDDATRFTSFMWVHEGVSGDKPVISGGFYPFVVCLQYQIREQKYWLMTESGWVAVSPRVDSVLVTIGDIAQVWSNGKLKKVRYRPVACSEQVDGRVRKCVTMSLLLTLPVDAMVSHLMPRKQIKEDGNMVGDEEEGHDGEEEEEEDQHQEEGERKVFRSFSFEEYAWRVYNERLYFKDPLDRYRIRS